jgi:hypothetical protein
MSSATISLLIGGAKLDPDGVTAILGVSPSDTRRACDPALRRRLGDHAWNMGQWCLVRRDILFQNIPVVIEEYCVIFAKGGSEVVKMGAEHQHIAIGLFEPRDVGDAFYLEPTLTKRISDLKITIMIDIYNNPRDVDSK